MNRLGVVLVIAIAFAAVAGLSTIAAMAGLVPDDAVTLWANAITAGDSEMQIGRIVAAYPTLPFFATTIVEYIAPAGTPTPVLLSAALLALIAATWFISFRRVGLSFAAALAAVLLLALHPALLRAALAGPSDIMFAVFAALLAGALFDLRARSGAPEVMAAAFALLGLAFSHPMGAALAYASIPLLAFAVRPELLGGSFYVVVALIFPSAFCLAAFAYMSWIFPGSGWSFLMSPAEGVATWSAGFSRIFGGGATGWAGADAVIAFAAAFVFAAPLIPVALIWIRRRKPLTAPTIILIVMGLAAALITVTTGLFGEPSVLGALAPILAGVMITRVPPLRERFAWVLPLLILGWLGGIPALAIIDPNGAANVEAAIEGRNANNDRIASLDLGQATIGRDGVLVDTFNAPAVVLGRGQARGLLSPASEAFSLGILFARIDAPFVAVPDPLTVIGAQDQLNRAFPRLYRSGAEGYRLIYESPPWRLFARIGANTPNMEF